MDKIEIMILVSLMAAVAGAYSVHWLFGLAHVARNLAALLPAAVVKAAIDCAIADALTCLPPSTGQGKADMIRNMMEGPQ